MDRPATLIDHLKWSQPANWSLLKLAATQGLASIDTSEDTVMLEEELRLRHQSLHDLMFRLVREWDPKRQRFVAKNAPAHTSVGAVADPDG
jgi:hypothetical protein